ncbi:MAG TPA: hypothetical protein VIL34_17965 [Actinopolymorphaceae bacterium]|jgi:hypothetical protein
MLESLTVGLLLLGLSTLTITLSLIAGAWLRECHDDLLEDHFAAVVTFSLRIYLRRRLTSRRILPGPLARKVLARVGTASAFPMLASIPFLFVAVGLGPKVGTAAALVVIVVQAALAGISLTLLLRGLRWCSQPEAWSNRHQISFPEDLGPRERCRAVLNMYWARKIPVGITVGIGQIVVLAIALVVVASQGLPWNQPNEVISVGSLVWIPAVLALPAPAIVAGRIGRRRMASALAISEVLRVLDLRERRAVILTPIRDPLWKERDGLGEIVALLRESARQLDARQRREMSPHPISHLLRASADDIHRFLRSDRSLVAYDIPDDIRKTLILVLKVLLGPAREETYKELNSYVSAFDGAGEPVRAPVAAKEKVTSAAFRVLNVLDQMSRIAPIVFWLLVVVALIIDGQASVDELVRILK